VMCQYFVVLCWILLDSAVQSGSLLIDSSTIDPATSQHIETEAASKGAVYMDSPVSGGTPYFFILILMIDVSK